MSTPTITTTLADKLRAIADTLDAHPDANRMQAHLFLDVREYGTAAIRNEAERVALVDGIAALFGLTAAPVSLSADYWHHKATALHVPDAVAFTVKTSIASPRRCACGADCTHSTS
ncbi:hypothetical protein Lfu02_31400 [Longispora fulva]|uniref:Uncharacterized protein n=1 Tax=Longispora fulva TaxID=619741 RepID=A0A8J7GVE2_9ACTN|nr:hypothetical protein [Longispora fulva]MBG6139274.1 hypothetical protein [Longispora fulva]GIG58768.1 hypothetical protein Lfu02_31400 [Longispora fulva]